VLLIKDKLITFQSDSGQQLHVVLIITDHHRRRFFDRSLAYAAAIFCGLSAGGHKLYASCAAAETKGCG